MHPLNLKPVVLNLGAGGASLMAVVLFAANSAQTDFLQKLHAINQVEIDIGNLAQKRGNDPEVKAYGKTLTDDHQRLDQRVAALAKSAGIDLNPKIPAKGVAELERDLDTMDAMLKETPSGQFDAQLASKMADGHKGAIQLVKGAEQQLKDSAEFQKLARDTRPILQKHEDIATALVAKYKKVAH